MITSLLYVSRKCISPEREAAEVAAIVDISTKRNVLLNVTGSLVATQNNFAQIIEGPQTSIDELMASIMRDQRHKDIFVLETIALNERRFADWSMSYSGPSTYVAKHIEPLFDETGGTNPTAIANLIRMMVIWAMA